MNKLIRALEQVDLEDQSSINRILNRLHSDVIYFIRRGQTAALIDISNLLTGFLSTNHSQLYQNQDLIGPRQKFFAGLESLISTCKESCK